MINKTVNYIIVIICMVALLSSCEVKEKTETHSETVGQTEEVTNLETGTEDIDNSVVTISSGKELVEQMASNTTFILDDGDYDLNKDLVGVHFDGTCFHDLSNVKIIGGTIKQIDFLTEDISAVSLAFLDSDHIEIRNLNIGHKEPDRVFYCTAEVLNFENCSNIQIRDTRIFGCGSYGVIAENIQGIAFDDVLIEDCAVAHVEMISVDDITFRQTTFNNDTNQYLFFRNCKSVTFYDSSLIGQMASYPQIYNNTESLITLDAGTENVIIDDLEIGEFVFENLLVQGNELIKEVRALDPRIKADLIRTNIEISGVPGTRCMIRYTEKFELNELMKLKKEVTHIVEKYYNDWNENYFIAVEFYGPDEENSLLYDRITYIDSYFYIDKRIPDPRDLLDRPDIYMTIEKAEEQLPDCYPVVYSADTLEMTEQKPEFQYLHAAIKDNQLFYNFEVSIQGEPQRNIQINAESGELLTMYNAKDLSSCKSGTPELEKKLMQTLNDDQVDLRETRYFSVFLIEKDLVLSTVNPMVAYQYEYSEDGLVVLDRKREYEGD